MGYSVDEGANDEEKREKEDQDYSTPFSPPQGTKDTIPKDHPEVDTDMDAQEWYDAGRSAAAGVSDPGSQGVLGYTPPADDDDSDDDEEE